MNYSKLQKKVTLYKEQIQNRSQSDNSPTFLGEDPIENDNESLLKKKVE
jgi:hypothetical protein